MSWKRFPRGAGLRSRVGADVAEATARRVSQALNSPAPRPARKCIVTEDGQLLEEELAHVLGKTGAKFPSLHEGKRYCHLLLLRRAGEIVGPIELHPKFACLVRNAAGLEERVGFYIADFRYTTKDGRTVVEDAKGWSGMDELYRWKKKHVQAQYGITIEEV